MDSNLNMTPTFPLNWKNMIHNLRKIFFQILNFDKGCDTVDEHYCSFSSNIHELLVGHSKINHNDVCLSYVFTYQHLADSTLGLAWSGNSKIGNKIICN